MSKTMNWSSESEIKDDVRKLHDLHVNNLVGDVKANLRDFYWYINRRKKEKYFFSYFPLCSCLNLYSDKFKLTFISCWLLKFYVFCFCFL